MINRTERTRLIDRSILEFCQHEFRPLSPLRKQMSSGTLYRHVAQLVHRGWLRDEGGLYRATDAGVRWLVEAAGERRWDQLEQVYPPLSLAPTPVHRALIELIFAAVVARQHETRPDRHPFFVCVGRTLRWKTNLGLFVCYALGLDSATHVVDCGSEAGKSLSFRRSSTGALVSRRELLDAPLLVLDEFLTADSTVRSTLSLFLGGRLVMPLENEQLTVRPVALLTLNPRDKVTLEERLGLSAPLIRRAIIADFDAVPMPDLATIGERALSAARAQGPLAISAPAVDCGVFHGNLVELIRAILVSEAHERVDVDVVVNLCTGMTAFIREPVGAIAQVVHALGIVTETLGWARPGWIEAVLGFTLEPMPSRTTAALSTTSVPVARVRQNPAADSVPAQTLPLQVARSGRRDGAVPELVLDDAFKAKLIWFSVDSGLSLQVALGRLLDFYLYWRRNKATVSTLAAILTLAEALEIAQVDCDTLKGYITAKAQLAKYGCTFEDTPEILKLLDLLGNLPKAWTWDEAHAAIQDIRKILLTGIDGQQIEAFLNRHQQLIAWGFDEATGEAVAKALAETGAPGEQRDLVIRALIEGAGAQVDCDALEQQRQHLQMDLRNLQTERAELRRRVKPLKTRVANLQAAVDAAMREKARIDDECRARAADLAVLHAFRALLLGHTADIGPFLNDVERLQQRRRQGRVPEAMVNDIRLKVIGFFKQIVAEAQGS